jgi:hypothetical protein
MISLIDNAVNETNLKLDVEQLGGFFFLESDSLEEAKAIVAKHPGLKVGAFEIRIVDEKSQKWSEQTKRYGTKNIHPTA